MKQIGCDMPHSTKTNNNVNANWTRKPGTYWESNVYSSTRLADQYPKPSSGMALIHNQSTLQSIPALGNHGDTFQPSNSTDVNA